MGSRGKNIELGLYASTALACVQISPLQAQSDAMMSLDSGSTIHELTWTNMGASEFLFGVLAAFAIYFIARHYGRSRAANTPPVAFDPQAILVAAQEGIFGLDCDGNTTFANPAALEITGYTLVELVGKPQHALIHHSRPDGTEYPWTESKILKSVSFGHEMVCNDEVFWRKDGSCFPVEYKASPVRNGFGGIDGAIVVFRDISEQVAAECRIHAERQHLEATLGRQKKLLKLIEMIAAESDRIDDERVFLKFVLDSVRGHFDFAVGHVYVPDSAIDELVPTGIWSATNTELFERFIKVTSETNFQRGIGLPGRVWESREPRWIANVHMDGNFPRFNLDTEIEVVAGVGAPVIVDDQVVAVLEFFMTDERASNRESLDVLGSIGAIVGRVIERARMESRLKQMVEEKTKKLKDSQERYELAVEGANDGIWDWDLISNDVYYSPRFLELVGYNDDKLFPRHNSIDDLMHPDDRERAKNAVRRHLKYDKQMDVDYRFLTNANGYRWFRARGAAVRIDGRAVRFSGSVSDITDLVEARRAAEQANRLKSEFLANMSHEIRTPLNGVLGMAEILVRDDTLTSTQREFIEVIVNSGENLLALLNDILDLSKIEAGELEIELVAFDLLELVENASGVWAPLAQAKNIDLETDVSQIATPVFEGDPNRLRQILVNLMGNAIKFTSQGGVCLRICQTPGENGRADLIFSIEDTGIGIPPERQEAIFDKFNQGDASVTREYGGSGLGLAISSRLAKVLGGELMVVSEQGIGSTFTLKLTLRPIETDNSKLVEGPDDIARNPPVVGSARILLVEDNALNQLIVKSFLQNTFDDSQLVLEVAANGAEAIAAAEANDYDIILMDIQMPDMDGYQATRLIRASVKVRDSIPIIALTADAMKGDREKCLAAGMNDYVAKPIKWDALFSAICRQAPEICSGLGGNPAQIPVSSKNQSG